MKINFLVLNVYVLFIAQNMFEVIALCEENRVQAAHKFSAKYIKSVRYDIL